MKEITLEELQSVEKLLGMVTPGPWNTGRSYDFARVNDGSGPPDWDVPDEIPEGGCHWCHPKFPEAKLVSTGVGPEGQNYHVHEHNDWVAPGGLDNTPEEFIAKILEENECTREEYDTLVREEQDKIDNDPRYLDAPWRFITSAETFQAVVGMYHYEQGGIATNKHDADFIAQCRELVPRLIEILKRLVPVPIDFPKEEYGQIEQKLRADLVVMTTRFSDDKGKYHPNQILLLPFKFSPKAIVKQVESFDKLEDHPYLDELTENQKALIDGNPFDVVWFYKLR